MASEKESRALDRRSPLPIPLHDAESEDAIVVASDEELRFLENGLARYPHRPNVVFNRLVLDGRINGLTRIPDASTIERFRRAQVEDVEGASGMLGELGALDAGVTVRLTGKSDSHWV
jgi:hypothetical protein